MSKKNDTWMPLYIGDYLADTSRLTTEQHGAYLLILMDYWRNGSPLDDDEELATIAKLSLAQWRKHAPKIRGLFRSVDGRLVQKRAEEERSRAGLISNKRREAGKQGAAARWGKEAGTENGEGMANGMATAMTNAKANAIPEPSSELWQNDRPSQSQSQSHTQSYSGGVGSSNVVGRVDNSDSPPLSADESWGHLVQLEAQQRREPLLNSLGRDALHRIADLKVCLPELCEAHARACARRADNGDPSPVNPGFLEAFVKEVLAERQLGGRPASASSGPWWQFSDGVRAHGASLGLTQREDKGELYRQFRVRVLKAAGPGPWRDEYLKEISREEAEYERTLAYFNDGEEVAA